MSRRRCSSGCSPPLLLPSVNRAWSSSPCCRTTNRPSTAVPTRSHYGAAGFCTAWERDRFRISMRSTAMWVKSCATLPKSRGRPAMTRTRTSRTSKPMPNSSNSFAWEPRWFSRSFCPCAGKPFRPPRNGCTEQVVDRKEFARRRRECMRMIGKDAIAVLPAAPVRHRNGDIEYAYRQDSQFHYLSGFPEPDAVAVLVPGRPHAEYLLFVREHDAVRESWDGGWAGTDGAVERYGADDAFPIADVDEILPSLMEQRQRIFYSMGAHHDFDPRMLAWVNAMRVQGRQATGTQQKFVAL